MQDAMRKLNSWELPGNLRTLRAYVTCNALQGGCMTPLSRNARIAGLLYIFASLVGIVRLMYIPNKLFVDGNAAATAGNLVAHESLFRWGLVSQLAAAVLWLFVPLALYRLLEAVDRKLAALMVVLGSLMIVPLFFVNVLNDVAALLFARGTNFLRAFDGPQRDAFASFFLNLHYHLDLANMLFWGLWLVPYGLLVYRSGFLPRVLGAWLVLACFGWLALSVTGFLFPAHTEQVYKITQPLVLGELVTMLWLVVMGAKEKRVAAAGITSHG